jgi:type IV secretory pathway VirD2 relaxase
VSPRFGQVRVFRNVLERKDKSLFIVSPVRLPPELLKAPAAKVRQDFFKEIAADEFNVKVKEEKNIKLGTMAGKEYYMEGRGLVVRARVYGTGALVFRVTVAGTKEQVNSKDAEIFFDSFKRTPKTGVGDKKDKK